jgi:hypothetical protein
MTTAIDLAKLVANHELAATLPPTVIPALLAEVERLRAALWMRLVTSLIDSARTNPEPAPSRLLTVPQVAELLGVPAPYGPNIRPSHTLYTDRGEAR